MVQLLNFERCKPFFVLDLFKITCISTPYIQPNFQKSQGISWSRPTTRASLSSQWHASAEATCSSSGPRTVSPGAAVKFSQGSVVQEWRDWAGCRLLSAALAPSLLVLGSSFPEPEQPKCQTLPWILVPSIYYGSNVMKFSLKCCGQVCASKEVVTFA